MRVFLRAYDLGFLRGTGITAQSIARYLVNAGDIVWASETVVSIEDLTAWRPDVIIGQEWATDEASAWATTLGLPFVMLVHGPDEYGRHMPQCDLVVFNTRIQQELAVDLLARTPSIVVHPPVFSERYATTGEGECLTLVGFDSFAYKGQEIFLDLAVRLPAEQFLLVTSDDLADLPPNVRTTPITPDIRSVYGQTKLLLMPSLMETYGRVAIEAAASGIPTVASDLPGIREATAGYGTYVADEASWEESVRTVLSNLDHHRERARTLSQVRNPAEELECFRRCLMQMVEHGRRRPTLTLCMCVSNEAQTLERALGSVRDVVDEIVIGVDERSTDETLRIAERIATDTFTFSETRPPDFARMRNRALERSQTDWNLVLDGHEWIEGADRIRAALETGAWSLELPILFEPDENRVPALSFPYPKIHRRNTRFTGPSIHEEVSTPLERRERRNDIKVWHERKPGVASSERGEEKAGPELNTLRSLWEEQGDRRALFYLANGLRETGQLEEAVAEYREYLKAPNWEEEGWQAQLYLARCLAGQGMWQEARVELEKAVLTAPHRAEGFVDLGYALLHLEEPVRAAAWMRIAAGLPEPEDCRLFLEVPTYRWGAWHGLAVTLHAAGDVQGAIDAERRALEGGAGEWAQQNIDRWLAPEVTEAWQPLFELGIHAYYAGQTDVGRDACERLLLREDVPEAIRCQTRRNQVFYAPILTDLIPETRIGRIDFPTQEGWSQFNPSIVASEEGYLMIGRSSNYSVNRWMHYTMEDGSQVIRTNNHLLSLSDDLDIRESRLISDSSMREGSYPFPVEGFEDCRLFRHRGRWRVSATTRERNSDGLCQMVMLDVDAGQFSNLLELSTANSQRHEKNWMPLVRSEDLFFIYSCYPTIVLQFDDRTAALEIAAQDPGSKRAEYFRGGSQAIPVENGYLFVIHESVDFEDASRVCPHRFVFMNHDFVITHMSHQFFFRQRTLEFCAGMAVKDGSAVLSFGFCDREAFTAVAPLNDVLSKLRPIDA